MNDFRDRIMSAHDIHSFAPQKDLKNSARVMPLKVDRSVAEHAENRATFMSNYDPPKALKYLCRKAPYT